MEENNLILTAIWFFAGALSFKFGSYIFGLLTSLSLVKDSILNVVGLLHIVDGQYEHARTVKYKNLKKTGSLAEEIDEIKKIDETIIKIWRETAINSIVNNVPRKLRPSIGFKTWDQAMKIFREK